MSSPVDDSCWPISTVATPSSSSCANNRISYNRQQTAEAAEVAIETNEGSLGNVIRAQVAAEEIATRIAQLEAERTGVLARMQALKGETGSGPALPTEASEPLSNALTQYTIIQNALASDTLDGVPEASGAFIEALQNLPADPLGVDLAKILKEAAKLARSQDLAEARLKLGKLSVPFRNLILQTGTPCFSAIKAAPSGSRPQAMCAILTWAK